MTAPFLNIAAYQFAELDELPRRRVALKAFCAERALKGTILLAEEGINLFVSGVSDAVTELVEYLREDPRLADLEVKESYSEKIAFKRMLVKIKREIIAFGIEGITPREYTSPRLPAHDLKQWLDEGREVVLLDVRNDFECELGTFHNAERIQVDHFRDFPAAIERLPAEWKRKPVVTFCTGGIRCEKAAPLMERAGFEDVYQLEGGILKYFESCGGDHYDGDCFVFDRRVSLDPNLEETDATLCFNCQHVLREADRRSPHFELDVSCPYCHDRDNSPEGLMRKRRLKAIRRFQEELPGARPYENARPLNMPAHVGGLTLREALREMFPKDPESDWRDRIEQGRIRYNGKSVSADMPVVAGQSFVHVDPEMVEPDVNADIEILEEDEHWIVVNKPAPLPVHPCGRFHRNTLTWMLNRIDRRQKLRPAHRLDANTTGVQILAKTREASQFLHDRFAQGEVAKEYLALVCGEVPAKQWECKAPIGDASGPVGVRTVDDRGKEALTKFELVEEFSDGTSLIRAVPVTGRTNQIRVHLWSQGIPIVGDPTYLADGKTENRQVLHADDPPLCLHAWKLSLKHPGTHQQVQLESPQPSWA